MTVSFRFYGYLNDFLPPFRRGSRFRQILRTHWSVKDALAVVGVPHSRVDVVVVNGTPVEFSCVLEDGDRVAVYPRFRSIDLGDIVRAGGRAR
ncbi:MAG TPA: hypothetical protein VHJ58_03040 [Vicinamibacterales bacterium]|nr:hypothetical protein [Vicinamibacterales bacterium]